MISIHHIVSTQIGPLRVDINPGYVGSINLVAYFASSMVCGMAAIINVSLLLRWSITPFRKTLFPPNLQFNWILSEFHFVMNSMQETVPIIWLDGNSSCLERRLESSIEVLLLINLPSKACHRRMQSAFLLSGICLSDLFLEMITIWYPPSSSTSLSNRIIIIHMETYPLFRKCLSSSYSWVWLGFLTSSFAFQWQL